MKIELIFGNFNHQNFSLKNPTKIQIFLYLVPVSSQKYGRMF
jgi:hypothetical protein